MLQFCIGPNFINIKDAAKIKLSKCSLGCIETNGKKHEISYYTLYYLETRKI